MLRVSSNARPRRKKRKAPALPMPTGLSSSSAPPVARRGDGVLLLLWALLIVGFFGIAVLCYMILVPGGGSLP